MSTTPIAQGPVDVNVSPLPCPFCGKLADLEDYDTLYPSGTGWKDEGGLRSYHSFRDVPKEQWCWGMHCPTPAGGCGAEIHGDSKAEALAKWNKRRVSPRRTTRTDF